MALDQDSLALVLHRQCPVCGGPLRTRLVKCRRCYVCENFGCRQFTILVSEVDRQRPAGSQVAQGAGGGGGGGTPSPSNEIPAINSISPSTKISFGTGITISNLTVVDDAHITVDLAIALTATIGARNVSVTTSWGTGTLSSAFTVNPKPPGGSNTSKLLAARVI